MAKKKKELEPIKPFSSIREMLMMAVNEDGEKIAYKFKNPDYLLFCHFNMFSLWLNNVLFYFLISSSARPSCVSSSCERKNRLVFLNSSGSSTSTSGEIPFLS